MTLTIGSHLGLYEVRALIGVGGMGEVYRAHDPRLHRDVAIKVLPPGLVSDPDRRARFEREARTLASLNHPNVAQIYGIEDLAGTGALVMELVDGPTLADRLVAGAIEPREAMGIARQIADALASAHERGIVHRDLKPANVKVRDDGTVKVLDFGLARPAALDDYDPLHSPTLTSPVLTGQGLILGTAAYMAPEQARGKAVDKRADIWAFGVVLFEMLTGRRLFEADTVSDTLAAVLRQEIPWTSLPPSTPRGVRRLLRRCLERDPRDRLQDIGDARLEIDEELRGEGSADGAALPLPRRNWYSWIGGAALGGAAIGAVFMWLARTGAPVEPPWQQFTRITDMAGEETAPSLSPDGASVAYASRARGSWDIYVQRVGGRNPVLVAGDPARQESGPAFSPDGQTIAYHDALGSGGIFLAGATGEASRRLTDFGFHPAWSPDGKQVAFSTEEIRNPYSRSVYATLWVVDATGGAPRKLLDSDASQPAWSPSGVRIAFWNFDGGQRDIYTVSARGGTRVPVLRDAPLDWCPVWSPDGHYLYFASDRGGAMNVWRIAIDEVSGAAQGIPEPVTAGVDAAFELPSFSRDARRLAFRSRTVSTNPVAIHLSGNPTPPQMRILATQNGTLIPTDVSPDGRALLLESIGERQEDLFIANADGTALRRLTDDAARDRGPKWSFDGRSIVFYSNRSGHWAIWSMGRDGGNLREVVRGDEFFGFESPIVSPHDGRLVFQTWSKQGTFNAGLADVSAADTTSPSRWRALAGLITPAGSLLPTAWLFRGRQLAGFLQTPSGTPAGVGIYDLASATVRQVSADSTLFVCSLPDGRLAYFRLDTKDLVLLDPESRRSVVVPARILPLAPSSEAFAVSRDGKTIYYGGVKAEADIWTVERGQS